MLKTLLFPIAILAFICFLILMGAFGLFVALTIISAFKWVFGLPGRRRARRAVMREAAAMPVAAKPEATTEPEPAGEPAAEPEPADEPATEGDGAAPGSSSRAADAI